MKFDAWRLVSLFACIVVAACIAGTIVWRWREPSLEIGHERPGFAFYGRLDDKRLWLGWRPRAPYRPDWAGQVNRWGFRYTRWSDGSGQVGVPVWVVVVGFGAAAACAEAMHRGRRRRKARGCCRKCGYDLRATPERCPECGTAAGAPSSSTSVA